MTGTATARIVGRDGLVRDLVSHLCRQADIELSEASAHASVTLLTDPEPEDWAMARRSSSAIVLIATDPPEDVDTVDAVAKGANAVVHSESEPDDLLAAIRAASHGEAYFDGAQAALLASALRTREADGLDRRLTRREREILACIADGKSVKQTATELGIAHKTVENIQSRLFAKLGVRNRAQAVLRAHSLRLLPG